MPPTDDTSGAAAPQGTQPQPPQDGQPAKKTAPFNPENQIFYDLMSIHPLTEFDEVYFCNLLEFSLSLSVSEKKRVVDAIPTLSQFQVDELHKVFEDEREEFRKLMSKEGEVIKDLVVKARDGWKQLREIYEREIEERSKANADQDRINALKEALGEDETQS